MQVPILNIHFSPARYSRLINLFDILNGSSETEALTFDGDLDSPSVPWYPAELSENARVLVWRVGDCLAFAAAELHECDNISIHILFLLCRESETVLLSGNLVSLSYLVYTCIFWSLKHLKTSKDV